MAAQAGVWWRISWAGAVHRHARIKLGVVVVHTELCFFFKTRSTTSVSSTTTFSWSAIRSVSFHPPYPRPALMRTPAAVVLCLTAATRPIMRPAASRSAPSQLILGRPPAASRSAPSQMIFGRPPPASPAPPAPPPTTPATEMIQRDLAGYASLLALGVVPAVDWVTLIGPDAVNPARLACNWPPLELGTHTFCRSADPLFASLALSVPLS